jgi:SagB-type dehydrogenase family enzyme
MTYDQLFDEPALAPAPLSAEAIGEILRYSLGLSAWKQFRESRWALRVNPSSGNLHPTEAYVALGPVAGLAETAAVYHYAPDRHALEERCAFEAAAWRSVVGDSPLVALVALTSVHWREAWKYGERAFRYCQHDLGHAIAAIRFAAALGGWRAAMLPEWSQAEIATLVGLDRDEDFADAEREEPACIIALEAADHGLPTADCRLLNDAVRAGRWSGRANQLSQAHVDWPVIDEVARATTDAGHAPHPAHVSHPSHFSHPSHRDRDARAIVLQRRSALAFDGRSSIERQAFLAMLTRTLPGPGAPWDALWWTPRIHLALFVHRVEGVDPGLYMLVRTAAAVERLKVACGREFLWEPAEERLPLYRLASGDCRRMAQRLSCDQEIASDGFFSLGMVAEFDASLEEYGPSFYRHLFWESGVIGQVLYLEAEAAGARSTGIGCFYDDPVHDVLGLTGHGFQSLYHFTVGIPVEDSRLTTEPGYAWERDPAVPDQH